MKNWKQSVFFGLVAIIALSFGFIGCGGDDGNGTETFTVQLYAMPSS